MKIKLLTTTLLSLWSIQSHAIMFIPTPGAYTLENAQGTVLGLGALVAIVTFLIIIFKVIEYLFLYTPPVPLNFSINLEDYKDEEFKTLDSKQLHIIYYENTALDKEVPCMYEAYKLDIIKQELNTRGEKTYI